MAGSQEWLTRCGRYHRGEWSGRWKPGDDELGTVVVRSNSKLTPHPAIYFYRSQYQTDDDVNVELDILT